MVKIELSKTDVSPGDVISGDVAWSDERPEPERIELRLIWYTSGKGDQDFCVVNSKIIEMSRTSSASSGRDRFEFVAPHRPSSFSGKLISLIWAIEAIVYPGKNGERTDILIAPNSKEIVLERSFERDKKMFRIGT